MMDAGAPRPADGARARAKRWSSEVYPEDILPGLATFIGELAAAACVEAIAGDGGALYVSELAFDLPVELELLEEDGVWRLGAAPPTQIIETTVMPVWHRARVRVRTNDGERGVDSVESR